MIVEILRDSRWYNLFSFLCALNLLFNDRSVLGSDAMQKNNKR